MVWSRSGPGRLPLRAGRWMLPPRLYLMKSSSPWWRVLRFVGRGGFRFRCNRAKARLPRFPLQPKLCPWGLLMKSTKKGAQETEHAGRPASFGKREALRTAKLCACLRAATFPRAATVPSVLYTVYRREPPSHIWCLRASIGRFRLTPAMLAHPLWVKYCTVLYSEI